MLDQRKKNGKWKGWWEVSQSACHRAGVGGEGKVRPEMGRSKNSAEGAESLGLDIVKSSFTSELKP